MKEDIICVIIIIIVLILLTMSISHRDTLKPRKRKREDYQVIKCSGNGNCLFEAIGCSTGENARIVRGKIINEMHENRELYESFFTPRSENLTIKEDQMDVQDKSYNHYLIRMSHKGQWGGNMELAAASHLYKRPIILYGPDPTTVMQKFGETKNNPIKVLYDGSQHYDCIE